LTRGLLWSLATRNRGQRFIQMQPAREATVHKDRTRLISQ
jgi:hypothetical protein